MDEKKKRGRKPLDAAAKADRGAAAAEAKDGEGVHSEGKVPPEAATKVEKKRGRKPKAVYAACDAGTSSVQMNSLSDDENIIVRLSVNEPEPDAEPEIDGGEHPYAYNRDEYKNIYIQPADIQTLKEEPAVVADDTTHLKIVSLLKDFEEKNKNKEWPSNTSICCYWCCHKFDNAPVGIPVILQKDVFHVFGCFCSLQCAAAYNFSSTNNIDEMWERYNLINMLSRRLNGDTQVRPAPDRLALKMFGGYMEIDQFRKYTESHKIININFPPMSSITQQIEEINEYELNNDYRYIPLDHDRINKIKEQMIVKRIKPIIHKNSLETSMNLKMSSVRGV